jgi:phage shock protein PspC (stress-responsive transcriptional regulator)
MKKVININFQGRVVPIEETAYDLLKQYIESLTKFFANEEGKEEIINDIEGRISELFAEYLKKGSTCITDEVLQGIIASIGKPEDFEAEELNVKEQLNNNAQNSSSASYNSKGFSNSMHAAPSKMYRDENNKILGGVCSGVANYFKTDASVIRVLTAIFFGVTFIPYLILWVVIPSTATQQIGSIRKRLFRNTDEKIIAGVCSGLSYYFGISVWIPRVLFLLPFISFVFKMNSFFSFGSFPQFINFTVSPGAIVVYVILWLILPEAVTAADKLEMKGEKVDLNSIKTTIQNDMEGFTKKVNEWGENINEEAKKMGDSIKQNTQNFAQQNNFQVKKVESGLGYVLKTLIKVIAYTIIGIVTLSVLAGLFSIGVVLTGLLPLKDFVIKDGWQNICAWGTLLLFVWVPVIGAITYIIRRLTNAKKNSNAVRYAFGGLWTIGWIFAICFIASLSQDFRFKNNPVEESIQLQNPTVQKLEIRTSNFNQNKSWEWIDFDPFESFTEDTAFVKNFRLTVIKSTNDSFQIKVIKKARGFDRKEANDLANKFDFLVSQKDTVLNISKGIAINKKDKFRNQHVNVIVAVPVGKRFKVEDDIFLGVHTNVNFGNDDDAWYNEKRNFDFDTYDFDVNVEYVMTQNGLKRVSPKEEDNNEVEEGAAEKNNTLEQYKNSREQLKQQIEKEKLMLEEQKRKLEEKEKEYKKTIDSSFKQSSTQNHKSIHLQIGDILLNKYST